MKPRLRVIPSRTTNRKWQCESTRADGVRVVGTGYSPKEAYAKWRRNRANA